jgi:hypothetical protein
MTARRPRPTRRDRVLSALAAAYFVVAAVGVVAPASADAVAGGHVWLLLTSGLAAQGPAPLAQVAIAAGVAALVVSRLGGSAWWRTALAGHVLAALIAYVVIGLVGAPEAAATRDYGVSCVLGASLGALLTVRRDRVPTAVGAIGALALVPLSFGWIGLEHPLSVVIGAAVTAWPGAPTYGAAWTCVARDRRRRP